MPNEFKLNYYQLVRLGAAMMSVFGPIACDNDESTQDEGEIVSAVEPMQRADVTIAMNRVGEDYRARPLVRIGGACCDADDISVTTLLSSGVVTARLHLTQGGTNARIEFRPSGVCDPQSPIAALGRHALARYFLSASSDQRIP